MNYFALRRRGDARPNLYLPTSTMAHNLWECALRSGMEHGADDDGEYLHANLETYFKVHVGKNIELEEFPKIQMFETPHIPNMENFGAKIGDRVFYSGDSINLPETNYDLIFQDCQFFEGKGDAHISYDKLKRELTSEERSKIYLVHLGGGYDQKNPVEDGFAGFVMPRQRFDIPK